MVFDQGVSSTWPPNPFVFTHLPPFSDGNGTITPEELHTLMKGVLGDKAHTEIDKIIKSVDADNSGTIDFDEFMTLMSDPKFCPFEDEHREVFKTFDKDGNGYISATELKTAFRDIGQWLSSHPEISSVDP